MKSTMLTLITALVLAGCGWNGSGSPDPYALLPGKWGWEGSDDCKVAPEVISFSGDRKRMYIALSPVREDGGREPRRLAEYRILRETPAGLEMSLTGETRTNDAGQPVTWTLVLMSREKYCWQRSDWGAGCTRPLQRCAVKG